MQVEKPRSGMPDRGFNYDGLPRRYARVHSQRGGTRFHPPPPTTDALLILGAHITTMAGGAYATDDERAPHLVPTLRLRRAEPALPNPAYPPFFLHLVDFLRHARIKFTVPQFRRFASESMIIVP
ncbi:MAG: hypothetical protein MI923_12975 [Phycisphaerales bacterium]|nr:hypothetical protein [Phycisphaerales bacterium]